MKLVIVESPAKARTIGRYLGAEYEVAASVGHVRDLPKKELGVDVENGFEPKYETIRGKGKVLKEAKLRFPVLRKNLRDALACARRDHGVEVLEVPSQS